MNRTRKDRILALLDETSEMINPLILTYTRVSNVHLQEMIDHALRPKSYKERPLLIRLSCEVVGGNFDKITPIAVAVELLHFSALVIDDVLDEAPLRSNDKTVQVAYGYKNAVIIGELLNALAFLALIDVSNYYNDKDKFSKIIKLFKETQRNLYYGQYLDLSFEHNEGVNESQYIDMISKTTASLIKCSLIAGAILDGGNEEQERSLAKYGESLGIAFQIRDDLAEIIGDPEIIGKQLGGDIKQGKMRLPLIHALSNAKKLERHFLREAIQKKKLTQDDITKCIEILINNSSIEYSKKVINDFCREAVEHLKQLPDSQAKDALIAFAEVIALAW